MRFGWMWQVLRGPASLIEWAPPIRMALAVQVSELSPAVRRRGLKSLAAICTLRRASQGDVIIIVQPENFPR